MAGPTDAELDAKLAAAEARTETRIARMEGKFDTFAASINARLDSLAREISEGRRDAKQDTRDARQATFTTIVASAFAVAGLIVAMAIYGDALFGRGMDVHKVVQDTVQEIQSKVPPKAP